MTALEILKTKYQLPVHSNCLTGQEVGAWALNEQQWIDIVAELRGCKDKLEPLAGEHTTKYVARYFIQNIVKAELADKVLNLDNIYTSSVQEATQYIDQNPWVFAQLEAEVKLNADGTPAPKKGDKKVIAKDVYEKNKDKGLARKQWIELLVKEVGLTPAGASTYYANLKSGKY